MTCSPKPNRRTLQPNDAQLDGAGGWNLCRSAHPGGRRISGEDATYELSLQKERTIKTSWFIALIALLSILRAVGSSFSAALGQRKWIREWAGKIRLNQVDQPGFSILEPGFCI
jgi:hypothetical protein